ncbi:hypothetical protein CULT_1430019 [[Clostridium] ultunense Esp]|nr:hypothetical protein CULT_1430019 [[Clostridium] ultunense Esp]
MATIGKGVPFSMSIRVSIPVCEEDACAVQKKGTKEGGKGKLNRWIIPKAIYLDQEGKERSAEFWVEEGRIQRIYRHDGVGDGRGKSTRLMREAGGRGEEKDGFEELILPGRIYERPLQRFRYHPRRYRSFMRKLLENGYTSFIDTIFYEGRGDLFQEILFSEALHRDSPLDFALRLQLPARFLTPRILTEAAKEGIKEIMLVVFEGDRFLHLPWKSLQEHQQHYDLHFYLLQKSESSPFFVRKKIEEALNYWYYLSDRVKLTFELREFPTDNFPDMAPFFPSEKEVGMSRRLAKKAGLFPKKGSFYIGADADLISLSYDAYRKGIVQLRWVSLRGKRFFLPVTSPPFGQGRRLRGTRSFVIYES